MHRQVKSRGRPVSEIRQKAVKAEMRRKALLAETDGYLTDLISEAGTTTAGHRARAAAVARRLARRSVSESC
jgi:hypothetical protein